MVYAYIRVSTEVQSYEGQRYEIDQWCHSKGYHIDHWVQEKASGTLHLDKRTLGMLLKKMKRNDVLICTELSRLGRNMMMVMSILNTCSQKGIRLYSIKDNFQLSDDLNSKIIAFAFSLAAEIERNLISQRTKEALAAKKKAGVKLGRPAGASEKQLYFESRMEEVEQLLLTGYTKRRIAGHLGIHYNTLTRYLSLRKEKK
jgi:DNA invertase Pin-like site-specific DNA recombinase